VSRRVNFQLPTSNSQFPTALGQHSNEVAQEQDEADIESGLRFVEDDLARCQREADVADSRVTVKTV
jgi:hypothetical protein